MSKKNHNNDNLDQDLTNIYKGEDGLLPDMTSLDKREGSRFTKIIVTLILIILVITGTAWSGFMWYNSKPTFTSDRVRLEIDAPFSIISGELMTYKIKINNEEKISIKDNQVLVRFPLGFILKESSLESKKEDSLINSKNSNTYSFTPPQIPGNSSYQFTVTGQLISEKDIKPTISARLTFSPENYSSSFEKNSSLSAEVIDSIIALTLSYDTQVANKDLTSISLTLKNISQSNEANNLKLIIEAPETFHIKSLSNHKQNLESSEDEDSIDTDDYISLTSEELEDFTENNSEIIIEKLEPGKEYKIKLSGEFEIDKNSTENIKVNILQQDARGDYIAQATDTAAFQVVKGEILANLIVNGSNSTSSIDFDSENAFLLSIQNKSTSTLGDLEVILNIDSSIVDWKTLTDEKKGVVSGNQILWTKEQVPGLGIMLPNDEVIIQISLRTKPYPQVSSVNKDKLKISSFFKATIGTIDSIEVTKSTESNIVLNSPNSNTKILSNAAYFNSNGETVGSGPLPPKVNEKTTYQLSWVINNSLHELKDIKLIATLPRNVNWEKLITAQAGTLDLVDNKIIWSINRMPTSIKDLNALFSISITPSEKDFNTLMTLLGEATLEAVDVETEAKIIKKANAITTQVHENSTGLIQK